MRSKVNERAVPRIGIDLVGSDTPPQLLLEAVFLFWEKMDASAHLVLFATEELFANRSIPSEIEICPVSEVIGMDEDPLHAMRRKKDSSINVAMQKMHHCELDAFVTAGNTGALIASAMHFLPLLPGITHPALLALIPTKRSPVAVLDIGANVHVRAEDILQFALMGIAYQKTRDIEQPTVGLLNIGTEKQKGTPELRKAYEFLQSLNHNIPLDHPIFLGNIEGRDVFHGSIDVLVTDGFTGNVFLKTAEGIAAFILDQLQNLGPIESEPFMKAILSTLRQRLHYAEYPGAILCGVDGVIVKFHGAASPQALINSIKGAIRLVNHFFLEKIKNELRKQLP